MEILLQTSQLAASIGNHSLQAEADFQIFQRTLRKISTQKAMTEFVINDFLTIPNLTGSQKAQVDYANWLLNHMFELNVDEVAAGDSASAIAVMTDPNWAPVFLNLAFDCYLRAGAKEKAKAVLFDMLEKYPGSLYGELCTRDAYGAGLLDVEGGSK